MECFRKPLLGYRCWRIDKGSNLVSSFSDSIWRPGSNTAECLEVSFHNAPESGCKCGFNAFYFLPEKGIKDYKEGLSEYIVWGSVLASGRVERFSGGWHSEHAQVLSLYLPKELAFLQGKVEAVSRKYDIPVFDNAEKMTAFSEKYGELIDKDFVLSLVTEDSYFHGVGCGYIEPPYESSPDRITYGGIQEWYDNYGLLHREGGLPARILPDGGLGWYKHGKPHRENGLPAKIWGDENRAEWWENGIQYWPDD